MRGFVGAARSMWRRAGDGLVAIGLFAVSLTLYVQTLAPSVATLFDDSLEFPLVSYRLGIAHPTGYPLYTLVGKLFSLGPGPNVAWALNFLSAVGAALTVALVYLTTRQLTDHRLPTLLGALALAVSPVFWSQSVIAEVYTLNSAFVVGMLWLALRWARRPLRPVAPFSLLLAVPERHRAVFLPGEGPWLRVPPAVRRAAGRVHALYRRVYPAVPPKRRLCPGPLIYALVFLYGLSLTHHRTMVLLAPALLVFGVLVERRVFRRAALLGPEHPGRPRWLQVAGRPAVLLVLAFLAPLLLYLYLPLRGHVGSLDESYINTWSGFWRWVMASDYRLFLGENPLARDLSAPFYGALFWRQFGPVGLALAFVGLVGLGRRPRALVLTALAFLVYVLFAIVYRVPDVEVFLIPAFLVVSVWIGVGLEYAAGLLRPRGRSLAWRRLLAICLVLLFLAAIAQPLVIAAGNYRDLDLSERWSVHDYGLYVLEQPLPAGSTVAGLLGEMTLLRYFQETAGLRPDVETIAADGEAARWEAVEAALAEGRAAHLTRPLPGVAEAHSLRAVTGLIDVGEASLALIGVGAPSYEVPDVPRKSSLSPVPGLRLAGYGVREHRGHWEAWARLRLWWQAPVGLQEPFKISARLLDPEGRTVAAVDAEPVAGTYPTTAWRPGEYVVDSHEIPLPAGLAPGPYLPQVIVYEPATGIERGRSYLEPVYLEGNPARPPRWALEKSVGQTAYALFGDVELLGFTPPAPEATHRAGDNVPLTLLWQARGEPASELQVAFWLEGDDTAVVGVERLGGGFPAEGWVEGQVVRHWPVLRVPGDTPQGTYRLMMRVIRDGQPVPWGRWFLPLGSDLDLGSVEVVR